MLLEVCLKPFFIAAAVLISAVVQADVNWNDARAVAHAAADASPSLAALKYQIAAARERIASAGSLPNPMVMGGVENQQADLSIDRMMTMYWAGASQTLTRRSKRETQRGEAELEVRRLEQESESQRVEVEREVLLTYYDAAAAQSQIGETGEIVDLAKQTTNAARLQYETGRAPQAEMIRAMLEEKNIEHQLLALQSRRAQALAKLAALVHVAVNEIPRFTLTHAAQHEHGAFDVSLNLNSPAFVAQQTQAEEAEQEIALAKLALKPDVTVEASYGIRPYQKDVVSITGRIELPYRKATLIEPRIREAIARRDGAKQQIEVLKLRLEQDIGVASALRQEAIEQIRLHENELVPAAKLGFQSALASYQAGKETFESVLSSLRTFVTLNIDYFDFLKQELQAEADIAALRGGARQGAASAAPAMQMR